MKICNISSFIKTFPFKYVQQQIMETIKACQLVEPQQTY